MRLLVFICTKPTVSGLENYPSKGPALVVINHLGDPDSVIILAYLPIFPDALAKIELYDIPVLGWVIENIGVIWVHRGRPDRRALTAVLESLRIGRIVIIAPEGRESVTGALEEGSDGAAFIGLKAGVPIVPVTLSGTENWRIFGNLKKLRRTPVSLQVGEPFVLPSNPTDHRTAVREGTRLIMERLARQLPQEYRGVYNYVEVQDE